MLWHRPNNFKNGSLLSARVGLGLFWALSLGFAGSLRGQATRSTRVSGAQTVQPVTFGRARALLIAVQDYPRDSSIVQLKYPVSDARQLASLLIKEFDFDSADVEVLANPTRDQLLDSLADFGQHADSNSRLLVFFAGHGDWSDERQAGYWLASSARRGSYSTYISMDDIRSTLRPFAAKHVLIIADACKSGSLFALRLTETEIDRRSAERVAALRSRRALTSATRTEPVPDRSLFLESLIRALREAPTAPYIRAQDLSNRVTREVAGVGGQTPQYAPIPGIGDAGGDFVFVRRNWVDPALSARQEVRSQPTEPRPEATMPSSGNFELGASALSLSQPAQAAPYFDLACKGGDGRGCLQLGILRESGAGLATDTSGALTLYDAGCRAGSMEACVRAGRLLEFLALRSRRIDREPLWRAARIPSQRACDAGDMGGCVRVGRFFEDGRGVTASEDSARAYFSRACDAQALLGCNRMAALDESHARSSADSTAIVTRWDLLCAKGLHRACVNLASRLRFGITVGVDSERALLLLRRACEADDEWGCAYGGEMVLHGARIAADSAEGMRMLKAGCRGGATYGCLFTGRREDLLRGCDLGDAQACLQFGVETYAGGGSEQVRARWAFERACDDHAPLACWRLAWMLRDSVGGRADTGAAVAAVSEAQRRMVANCEAGHAYACVRASLMLRAPPIGPTESTARSGEDPASVKLLQGSCEHGDVASCGLRALSYLTWLPSPDEVRARELVRLLEAACPAPPAEFDAQSCLNLAILYRQKQAEMGFYTYDDWNLRIQSVFFPDNLPKAVRSELRSKREKVDELRRRACPVLEHEPRLFLYHATECLELQPRR